VFKKLATLIVAMKLGTADKGQSLTGPDMQKHLLISHQQNKLFIFVQHLRPQKSNAWRGFMALVFQLYTVTLGTVILFLCFFIQLHNIRLHF
jgi:hypothetical protein